MTKQLELYKCEICGNIIEVMHTGAPALVCCGQKMTLLTENIADASVEKHVPVIEKLDNGWKISIGEIEHPMIDSHYIELIQLITENKVYTKFLNPNDKPEAIFKIDADNIIARAYCNIHGNWKKQL